MRPRLPVVLLATAGALGAGAASAAAVEPAECGGRWSGSEQTCTFTYGGGAISAWLSLTGNPFGVGTVRLEVDAGPAVRKPLPRRAGRRTGDRRAPLRRVLISCTTGGSFGACSTVQFGDEDAVQRGSTLHCVVTGHLASGSYGCSSEDLEGSGTSTTNQGSLP